MAQTWFSYVSIVRHNTFYYRIHQVGIPSFILSTGPGSASNFCEDKNQFKKCNETQNYYACSRLILYS